MKWKESEHPRDEDGKFTSKGKYYRQNASYAEILASYRQTIKLPDEQLPKSLSAKWRNYDIAMPDGSTAHFVEGSKLHHIEVFAGKGTKTPIRDRLRLTNTYKGTNPDSWQKVKGFGTIELNGKSFEAEIHWYQAKGVGKVELKAKI